MRKLALFLISCFAAVFFALPASADNWDSTHFNDPTITDISLIDTSTNYWRPVKMSNTGGTSYLFPNNIYYGSNTMNCYSVNCWTFYEHTEVISGSNHYYNVPGLSDYSGMLIACFTVSGGGHSTYSGISISFRDSTGSVLPTTIYRNGELLNGVSTVSVPKELQVYHYEVLIDCTSRRLSRIQYSLGYEQINNFFFFKNSPNPFDDVVLFKCQSQSFSFRYAAYRDGSFDSLISCQLDNGSDYRVNSFFVDLDSLQENLRLYRIDQSDDHYASARERYKLFSSNTSGSVPTVYDDVGIFEEIYYSLLDQAEAAAIRWVDDTSRTFDAYAQEFASVADDELNSGFPLYQEIYNEITGKDKSYVILPSDDAAAIQQKKASLQSHLADLRSSGASSFYSSHLLDCKLAVLPSSSVSVTPYLDSKIFGSQVSGYLDFYHPFNYHFDFVSFYRSFGNRSDYPASGNIGIVFVVYHNTSPLQIFVLSLNDVDIATSAIDHPADESTLTDDSLPTVPIPTQPEQGSEFTLYDHALYMEQLMNCLQTSIHTEFSNLRKQIFYQNTYNTTNYYTTNYSGDGGGFSLSPSPSISFDVDTETEAQEHISQYLVPKYDFKWNAPEEVVRGANVFTTCFDALNENLGIKSLILFMLSVSVGAWFLHGKR